ncbi:thioesterase II family protein [Streptomyces sp. NPDC093589]|uniref:thioesterase II family protein n=1 Tax=Streptomyces sp. NPDC093589 TaxID=3366043 RepID=UPI0038028F66
MKRIGSGALYDFTPPRTYGDTAILLLPALGGNAIDYATWIRHLDGFRVLAAQYPGREGLDGVSPAAGARDLAAELADQVRLHVPEPLVIFGHSMGALIGYETAWRLQEMAQPALGFYASAALSPTEYSDIHLGVDGKSAADIENLAGDLGIPLPQADSMRQKMLLGLRQDLSLVDAYHYGHEARPLTCSFTVITALSDQVIPLSSAEKWAQAASHPLVRHEMPGGHGYIFQAIAPIARILRAAHG